MAAPTEKLDNMSVGELRKLLSATEGSLRAQASSAVSVLRALGRAEDAKKIESITEIDLSSGRPVVFKRGSRQPATYIAPAKQA